MTYSKQPFKVMIVKSEPYEEYEYSCMSFTQYGAIEKARDWMTEQGYNHDDYGYALMYASNVKD